MCNTDTAQTRGKQRKREKHPVGSALLTHGVGALSTPNGSFSRVKTIHSRPRPRSGTSYYGNTSWELGVMFFLDEKYPTKRPTLPKHATIRQERNKSHTGPCSSHRRSQTPTTVLPTINSSCFSTPPRTMRLCSSNETQVPDKRKFDMMRV